jgi:hypothetical protein
MSAGERLEVVDEGGVDGRSADRPDNRSRGRRPSATRPAFIPVGQCPTRAGARPHRLLLHTAVSSTLHVTTQEGVMHDDRERFSRTAAFTAVLTLSCTIGILYLPLFLR